jgi:hypothetical protein
MSIVFIRRVSLVALYDRIYLLLWSVLSRSFHSDTCLTPTGATLHTVCVTEGPLSTYKLFARVYGGKSDKDINVHNPHTVTRLKMVSLYGLMLDPFKHKGHCVVMDSAYMGDAMCQVGYEEWGIKAKEIKKGTHKSLLYQHKTKPLLHAVWADNTFVKTLSNFHSPTIVEGGMKTRVRGGIPLIATFFEGVAEVRDTPRQGDYIEFFYNINRIPVISVLARIIY